MARAKRKATTAPDGTRVPMSVVYKAGFERNGEAPALVYGYGSYESSMDPYFSSVRLSLLDRGFRSAVPRGRRHRSREEEPEVCRATTGSPQFARDSGRFRRDASASASPTAAGRAGLRATRALFW